jgi:hypothetical protein
MVRKAVSPAPSTVPPGTWTAPALAFPATNLCFPRHRYVRALTDLPPYVQALVEPAWMEQTI